MKYRPFAILLVLTLCVWSAQAQSGRRHAKPAPATPVPTPTPEPTPTPKKVDKESQLLFYVGADRNGLSAAPDRDLESAAIAIADRLGGSAEVDGAAELLREADRN